MAALAIKERELCEVVYGKDRVERRLERDVKEFCCLLEIIRKSLLKGGVDLNLQKYRNLKSRLQRHFLDIYMCLKLHLEFHLGGYIAFQHNELSTLRSQLSDEPEVNNPSDTRHAIDPGSKVLEIVSMQFLAYGGT